MSAGGVGVGVGVGGRGGSCSSCVAVHRHVTERSGRATIAAWNGEARFYHGISCLIKSRTHIQKRVSLTCASSNNSRRNPDFSRQQRGSSRGRSRKYQERDNADSIDESDILSAKNGPLLALSNNPRGQATAIPGQREKEIVELFRKVQAQLRERAALKEEKKIEAANQGQNERGTVDSLLKLLRKHSADQIKRNAAERDRSLEQPEGDNGFEDDEHSNLLGQGTKGQQELEPRTGTLNRPVSSFRRRSPVNRVKLQSEYSADEEDNTGPSPESEIKKTNTISEEAESTTTITTMEEPLPLDGLLDFTVRDDQSDSSDVEDSTSSVKSPQIDELKLTELRELAKSQGIKGYSKLKKSELVELLRDEA